MQKMEFSNQGEMATLFHEFDWSRTPFGPVEDWPDSLRSITSMIIENRFAMTLWWGPDLLHIYNDGYIPILGDKHPASLAQPAAEVWKEVWHIIKPQAEGCRPGRPMVSHSGF